jgi:hypothetical protein
MLLRSSCTAFVAAILISAGASGVYGRSAGSVTQFQKTKTCEVLAQISGLEEYEISAFAVRCERTTLTTKPEVPTDPRQTQLDTDKEHCPVWGTATAASSQVM